jgi:hypothetical protein
MLKIETCRGMKTAEGIADMIEIETGLPELLEACKALCAEWDCRPEVPEVMRAHEAVIRWTRKYEAARAAIAKAEGK